MLSRRTFLFAAGASSFVRASTAASPATSATLRRGYTDGPYGQIHYRAGVKGEPLVMMHQANASSRQFERVYPLFIANGFRPIGIDLPGYGNSDPMRFAPKVEDWAKIIPPVLDALNIRQAYILGHHTGATVATEFSLQHPERTRKLVIHGAYPVTPEERAEWLNRYDRTQEGPIYKADGSHLSSAFANRRDNADLETITRYAIDLNLVRAPQWWGFTAVFTYDHEGALRRVRRPTLLVTNDGDQIHEWTLRARTLRPDFSFVELQGGTTNVQDELPEPWVNAITKFLKG